ncbi:MAG: hypothetical protein OT477_23570 [Chloroflexi bacterium]|nr:hypothetical protein [Chloroflexota bacterium]
MDSKLSRWCDTVIEIGCLIALLAAPLFFNIHSDRVFEPDKLTLLRSLALFLSCVWLVKFVDQGHWRSWEWARWQNPRAIWHTPFVLPVVALAVVYLLSTLFSVTPRVSWAGSYQRLQGTYTTLSYLVIFALAVQTFRTAAQIQRAVTAVIIATIPVALYGMLQRFGLDPLPWGGNVQTRIAGHMGNAIFIAAYLIMGVPLTLGRIINSFWHILSDEELNPADIIRSSIYIFVFAIQLIAIWWSGSRGPQLGLGVGLFAFVLIFLVALRNSVQGKTGYSGRDLALSALGTVLPLASFGAAVAMRPSVGDSSSVLIFGGGVALTVLLLFILVAVRRGWLWLWLSWIQVVLVMGAFLLAFNFVPPATEAATANPITATFDAWRGVQGIGRLGRMLEAEGGTGRVRVLIWEGTVNLVLPHEPLNFPDGSQDTWNFLRPFIGYGPEAMYVAYNSFYPPELASLEARNASPDRSHNETWDALVITGLFGFLAWQWLYLTMFYHGFRWLGVAQSKFDRNLLVGLWVGAGAAVAIAFSLWRGPAYIGVSWPLGNIIGLIAYLIYYAITAKPAQGEQNNPFSAERLLLIALLGGMIAHYVEIHFGIAIAVTRVHFFMFAALMLVLGTQQATADEAAEAEPLPTTGKQRRPVVVAARPATGWGAPAAMWSFLLALVIALMAFSFTNYSPPPGKVIQSMADLPTAAEIFSQSFFVNPAKQFAESPFLFLVLVMSWLLGTLLAVSEMVRSGLITLTTTAAPTRKESKAQPNHHKIALALFGTGALMGLVLLLIGLFGQSMGVDVAAWGTTQRIGHLTVAPLVLLLCVQAAVPLLRGRPQAHVTAGTIAAVLFALSLPLLIAGGGWYAAFMLVASGFVLYLLWDTAVANIATPALTISLTSFVGGLIFALVHANQLRGGMITPAGVNAETPETVRRVAEAVQYAGILNPIYLFIFTFLLVTAVLIVLPRPAKTSGSNAGWIALPILLLAGLIGLRETNLQVVQADIIYKRGKPFDSQAPSAAAQDRAQGLILWDNAIAIYEKALELAPNEDFYYLWLGRAYLEKATLVAANPTERDAILTTAEESLFVAQRINPLNTDHTANLARLNTRWAGLLGASNPGQAEKVEDAQAYYRAAISLSPQNAVVRNEYGRMTYSFSQSCAEAMPIYEESRTADPFYAQTPLEMAEIQIACATNTEDTAERATYYDDIMANLEEGLRIATEVTMKDRPPVGQVWARAAQAFAGWEEWDMAIAAYEVLLERADNPIPVWQTHIQIATAYNAQGEKELALAQANIAKEDAPAEVLTQIEAFISTIGQ